MATTWATLEANADKMRQLAGNQIADSMTDDEVKAIKKEIAKNDVKRDICEERGLIYSSTSDMSKLDSIAGRWTSEIQDALMFKQLEWYFSELQEGQDTKTYSLFKYFQKLYLIEKNKFRRYSIESIKSTRTMRLARG